MGKIQQRSIGLEEALWKLLEEEASDLGLSVAAHLRLVLRERFKDQIKQLKAEMQAQATAVAA